MDFRQLRERIREDVEFNFYNAKRAEIEFQGIHPKGNSLCARLLLPELLPDYVERINGIWKTKYMLEF